MYRYDDDWSDADGRYGRRRGRPQVHVGHGGPPRYGYDAGFRGGEGYPGQPVFERYGFVRGYDGRAGFRHGDRYRQEEYGRRGRGRGDVYGPPPYAEPRRRPGAERYGAAEHPDERLRGEVYRSLLRDGYLDAGAIEVEVDRGVVTLSGEVQDYMQARYAWDDAWDAPGVRGVVNRLEVAEEARTGGEEGTERR